MKPKKTRSAAIILKGDHILLMHRKNSEWVNNEGIREVREYWVFPGGTVEENETPEHAVVREVFEETTLQVSLNKLLYSVLFIDKNYLHYFYLCNYVSGNPAIHENSPEAQKMKAGTQWYEPTWIPLERIRSILLYPHEVQNKLQEDIKTNFADCPRHSEFSSESELNAKPNYF